MGQNTFRVIGNIVTYNALPDIQRCLDSISGICDEVYIADSFSTDGTWEWLNNVKDVYNLKLYQNKFESFLQQRTFLLDKTPKPCWLIAIDADESFNTQGSFLFRNMLHSLEPEAIQEKSKDFVVDLVVDYLQLKGNIRTRSIHSTTTAAKVFYCDENIRWKNTAHCFPHLKGNPDDKCAYLHLEVSPNICIKHHAFLDPKKMEAREKRIKGKKDVGQYEYDFYYKVEHKLVPLEEELW